MIQIPDFRIVLGSKSPRRAQLMTEAGFVFDVKTQDIDEDFLATMPVLEVAEDLAKRKAAALLDSLNSDEILITADSVVILQDVIYNKPSDYDQAFEMLKKLSGNTHTVATGVCITTLQKSTSFTVVTDVSFGSMEPDEIDYYISTFEPFDKAGSYGIQDWIGLCKIHQIKGSYSNVMGLPMFELYHALKAFG